MEQSRKADISVFIEFGITDTRVGWHDATTDNGQGHLITDWPGGRGMDALPSAIAKRLDADGSRKWGFLCSQDADSSHAWRGLRVLMEPQIHELAVGNALLMWAPMTIGHVHDIVADYLSRIYSHIRASISKSSRKPESHWDNTPIDFFFSIPNTWRGEDVFEDFEAIVRKAGYGVPDKHRAVLSLTEAEAATMSFVAEEHMASFQSGEVVLSISAGVGSTEVACVQLGSRSDIIRRQVGPAFRKLGLGSELIDGKIRQLVSDRLTTVEEIGKLRTFLPKDFDLRLRRAYFSTELGAQFEHSPSLITRDMYYIPMPGVPEDYASNKLRVQNGSLIATREEISQIFEKPIDKIKDLMNKAFSESGGSIDYICLYGELGSEFYISLILQRERSSRGIKLDRKRRSGATIINGLFLNHLKTKAQRIRTARESCGVIIQNQQGKHNPPKLAIKWFIKEGAKILPKEETVVMERRVDADPDGSFFWTDIIVCSSDPNLSTISDIDSPVITRAFQLKLGFTNLSINQSALRLPRPWSPKSNEFYTIKYNIHLSIGPVGDYAFRVTHSGKHLRNTSRVYTVNLDDLKAHTPVQPDSPAQFGEHQPTPPEAGTGGSGKASASIARMSLDSFYSERGSITPSVGNVSHRRYYYRDEE